MIDSKLIKVFIPFIGTILIVCGYIKLNIIFNHFDININNYLEFSEIITLFLPDIVKNIIFIFFIFFIVYLFISTDKMDRNYSEHKEIINTKSSWKRFKLFFKKYQMIGTWSILIFIITIVLAIWFPEKLYNYILTNATIPAIFIFNWISHEFKRKYNLVNDKEMSSSYSMLAFTLFIFLVFTINSAFFVIKDIKNNKTIVSFVYINNHIKSDKNNLYLGQTKNYVFIKNTKSNTAHIYERKQITNFSIKPSKP
jgi:hypothetical protein